MQHHHEEELTNDAAAGIPASSNTSISSHQSHSQVLFDLGLMPQPHTRTADTAFTRKRMAEEPAVENTTAGACAENNTWKCTLCNADNLDPCSPRCGVCRARRHPKAERRPSWSDSSVGSFSLGLDDLVANLEGIDVVSSGNASVASTQTGSVAAAASLLEETWNDSAASSRWSSGMWSLQDLEPWSCQTCTFENDAVLGYCEMCGQSKPTTAAAPSEAEKIRLLQEERLRQLRELEGKPAPKSDVASAAAALQVASIASTLPAIEVDISSNSQTEKKPAAFRTTSPKPPRGRAAGTPGRVKRSSNYDTSGTIPSSTTNTHMNDSVPAASAPSPRAAATAISNNTTKAMPSTISFAGNDSFSNDISLQDASLVDVSRRRHGGGHQSQQRMGVKRVGGPKNLDESNATAATFNMSSSIFSYCPEEQQLHSRRTSPSSTPATVVEHSSDDTSKRIYDC